MAARRRPTAALSDVLLLDEPPDHLDVGGLALPPTGCGSLPGGVVVSHDDALLADVAEQPCLELWA